MPDAANRTISEQVAHLRRRTNTPDNPHPFFVEGRCPEACDNCDAADTIESLQAEVERLAGGVRKMRELAWMLANGKGVVQVRKCGAQFLALTEHLKEVDR